MAKRGNPSWGRAPGGPILVVKSAFEVLIAKQGLREDQYREIIHSQTLREWARRNSRTRYIPEVLLDAWGFEGAMRGDWD